MKKNLKIGSGIEPWFSVLFGEKKKTQSTTGLIYQLWKRHL
jgi:hypothetical protein